MTNEKSDVGTWKDAGELDAATCRALRVIAFDVDDTVTQHGRLERVAFDAMWDLFDAGIVLVAATGRPMGWTESFARYWPIHAAVGENGAGWAYRRAGTLLHGSAITLEASVLEQRLDEMERIIAQEFPEVRTSDDRDARRYDRAFDIGETCALAASEKARLRARLESLGAHVLESSIHLHASFGRFDKASGVLAALRDACGLELAGSLEEVLFIGDSPNDEPAFRRFPLSVGVANLRAFARDMSHLPAFIARRTHGEGFAEIAQLVMARRREDPVTR